MTAIANGIRTISGTTSTMGLDAMATHISNANTNVSSEANIIAQISTALDGKAAGVNLNFDIKSYSIEDELLADKPSENTIGIITNIEINGYCFSENLPKGIAEGKVWITTGKFGNSEFYLLDNETIVVHPLSAKQYVNGAWVDVEAKSYQNGEWVDWVQFLFKDGNQYAAATGGWGSQTEANSKVTFDNTINVLFTGATCGAVVYTNHKIDVTNLNKICARIKQTDGYSTGANYWVSMGLSAVQRPGDWMNYNFVVSDTVSQRNVETVLELNTENISGEYFLDFRLNGVTAEIYEVWAV
jgi:hypothetical protein